MRVPLPSDWENKWHTVIASYNGKEISLSVDGKNSSPVPVSGNIRNTPFPVNIGRDAEIHGQETRVYICDAVIDQVRIFTRYIPGNEVYSKATPKDAALWLDFEEMTGNGWFYSYGIGARTYGSIWPDRVPQPEMWQFKKSGQPVSAKVMDADKGEVEIKNRYLFTDLSDLDCRWAIEADGAKLQEGSLSLKLEPQSKSVFTVPFSKPELKAGTDYTLTISFHQKQKTDWADKGYEIAWDQFILPWSAPYVMEEINNQGSLTARDERDRLIITGKNFIYIFDKSTGALSSMKVNGKEIISRGGELNLWRAPLANETDEWGYGSSNRKHRTDGFGRMASTEWYSAGLDRTRIIMDSFSFEAKGDNKISVNIKNLVELGTGSGAFRNNYVYVVEGNGEMTVNHSVIPDGDMPSWLPGIGNQWILDKSLGNVEWFGRGPQENYPDRKSGYRTGDWKMTVKDMYEPYLIPQDYGLRCDNRWVRLTDDSGSGLEFSSEKYFNFSAHPYSDDNLTKALYTYQLHPSDYITFDFDYLTSGVGCTARSVFPEYQVMPQRVDFRYSVKPVTND